MNKEYLYLVIYKNLSVLINYCWFLLVNSLFFLIKFIAQHIFRVKKQDRDIEQSASSAFGEEIENEEPSSFSFKFENQIPKMSSRMITGISNYRVLSEKDFCGFVEEPKASTFQVHESFIETADDLEKPGIQSKDVDLLKDQEIEEKRATGFGTSSLDGREFNDSFNSFDYDSDSIDSISLSDGQSVKSLAIDAESAVFFSERDIVVDNDSLIDSTTFEVELMDVIEKLEEEIRETKTPSSSNLQIKLVDSSDDELPYYSTNDIKDLDCLNFPYEEHMLKNFGLDTEFNSTNGHFQVPSGDFEGYENIMLEEKSDETESNDRSLDHSNFGYQGSMHNNSVLNADFNTTNGDHHVLSRDSEGYQGQICGGKNKHSESDDGKNLDCSNYVYQEHMHTNLDLNPEFDSTNDDHQALKRDFDEYENKMRGENFEETRVNDLECEDLNDLESHQDLIEMLKLELKRVRTGGLPTIFEESESPKSIEDLKPWNIDEKLLEEDLIGELHKLYKSYKERMRKLDILNYQKMHAIGFLQLKNPLESMRNHKPLIPKMISHFTQNLKTTFRQNSVNPSENFVKEVQIDLETVYVGQTCLSWEFLHWQYEKVHELPSSDWSRNRQYNQVAGEFQQFQVILQRFIENEPFQGHRLKNYVQNRCVLRNLLQVPVIKENCTKDKLEERRKGIDAITIEMLEDIMEETIRLFWEFLKAEKDDTSIILKGLIRNHVELQDPSDFRLMSNIQSSLQKKEKILKEIVKAGNCLVRKFKRPREERSNQDIFFSEIDMKLISRVLKMSRITTEQLVWCHKKLNKIITENRKIHRQPSFLLFPC